MAPATILFHRLARQEYQKAFRWYARRSYQAALGFENEVIRCYLCVVTAGACVMFYKALQN